MGNGTQARKYALVARPGGPFLIMFMVPVPTFYLRFQYPSLPKGNKSRRALATVLLENSLP